MTKIEPVDFSAGWSAAQLREQIDARRRVMRDMVGRLYPKILAKEIERLEAELRRAEKFEAGRRR